MTIPIAPDDNFSRIYEHSKLVIGENKVLQLERPLFHAHPKCNEGLIFHT